MAKTEKKKQLAFAVDQEIIDLIEKLKKDLGVSTSAAVFKKSLAIAKLAAEQAEGSDGIVTMKGRKQDDKDQISFALNT